MRLSGKSGESRFLRSRCRGGSRNDLIHGRPVRALFVLQRMANADMQDDMAMPLYTRGCLPGFIEVVSMGHAEVLCRRRQRRSATSDRKYCSGTQPSVRDRPSRASRSEAGFLKPCL